MSSNLSMNKEIYLANKIISIFKSNFLNDDGLISRTFPVSERTIFDNFDDIVPFFIYFGETDFLVEQIRKSQYLTFESLLGFNGIILSHKIDEYIGGLYAVYRATNKEKQCVNNALSVAIDRVFKYFIYNDDLLMAYDISQKKRINVRTFWSSGLLETFLEMGEDYPNLLSITFRILDNWINTPFFLKYGLFPFRVNPGKSFFNKINNNISIKNYRWNSILNKDVPVPLKNNNRELKYLFKRVCFEYLPTGNFIQLMKANSTMIFLLIEAYRITGNPRYCEAIEYWIESIYEKLCDGGKVYGYADMKFNRYNASLADAFIYIDILCDYYFFVNKKIEYLNRAKNVAEKWLSLQWNNALIPMFEECEIDHIDNLVDFSISLRRLSELIGNNVYLDEAKKIMDAAITFHYTEAGFVTHVTKSGLQVSGKPFNNIDPKYNALFLKGLINLLTTDKLIYNSTLHDLFKDR